MNVIGWADAAYEMLPCADCPASKPTYAEARIYISKEAAPKPIKVVLKMIG